jgi:hypothetical protein
LANDPSTVNLGVNRQHDEDPVKSGPGLHATAQPIEKTNQVDLAAIRATPTATSKR